MKLFELSGILLNWQERLSPITPISSCQYHRYSSTYLYKAPSIIELSFPVIGHYSKMASKTLFYDLDCLNHVWHK